MSIEISVAMDEVLAAIKRIEASHAEFPDPGALAHTSGPAAGASQHFRSELNATAQLVSSLTERIRTSVTSLQAAIEMTAQDLMDADSSVGGDLTSLTGLLESASVPGATPGATNTTVKPPTPASGGAAAANTVG